jgi:two-component sensor histidine kinase
LIINELVSNAYKHAFPSGGPGTVELQLTRNAQGWLVLEVADSGRGIPEGIDLRQTRSLGMQLVHTLVQQLRGTIEVHHGPGARFVLKLQEAPQKQIIR